MNKIEKLVDLAYTTGYESANGHYKTDNGKRKIEPRNTMRDDLIKDFEELRDALTGMVNLFYTEHELGVRSNELREPRMGYVRP